jgi:hypothetical protein
MREDDATFGSRTGAGYAVSANNEASSAVGVVSDGWRSLHPFALKCFVLLRSADSSGRVKGK